MSQSLPAQPSLRQLQIQAKELARQFKQRQPEAVERLKRHHPRYHSAADVATDTLQLHDAQLVLAREYGFESWPKLRAHVDRVTLRRLVEAVQRGELAQARSLVRQNPNLVNLDLAENDEHRVLHFAVMRRDEPMVRMLMQAGADPHKGIYPHREATTALVLARERGYDEIVRAIEEEEESRREGMSCPNATISPAQDRLAGLIRQGDHTAALAMLEADPALAKACDREGGTVLHVACEAAALPVIDWLLGHHANPRHINLKGWTPLESAIVHVNWKQRVKCDLFPEVARRLLRHGAEITPLVAAATGNLDVLRIAERNDPKGLRAIHARGQGGPLSVAVIFGKPEIVKLLLDLGLDPNERHALPNLEEEIISQSRPLWLAAGFGEYAMARLLLDHGADPCAHLYASGSPVSRAYGARDGRMMSLLAEFGGHPDAGQIGASRDIAAAEELLRKDSSEKTVEDLLWGAASGGSPEIVRMTLPKLGWPPTHPRWFRIVSRPLSLMNHAPHSEHPELFDRSTYPECLRLILAHGVDVNVRSARGATLLHSIMAAGRIWDQEVMTDAERLQFTRITLAAWPDLTVRDDLLKSTPLGWACRWGRTQLAALLLEHGADAEEPEAESWATPLAWARKMGHRAIEDLVSDAIRRKNR